MTYTNASRVTSGSLSFITTVGSAGNPNYVLFTINSQSEDATNINIFETFFINYTSSGSTAIVFELWAYLSVRYQGIRIDFQPISDISGSESGFEYKMYENISSQVNKPTGGTIVYPTNAYSFPKYPNGLQITNSMTSWSPDQTLLSTYESETIFVYGSVFEKISGYNITVAGTLHRVSDTVYYLKAVNIQADIVYEFACRYEVGVGWVGNHLTTIKS